jgi:N-acetylneuraminic acid mutarotase
MALLPAIAATLGAAAAGSWHAAPSLAQGRQFLGVGVLNRTLYAMGGLDQDLFPTTSPFFASVEAWNHPANSWAVVVPNMSVPRFNLGVGVLGTTLLAVGGASPQPHGEAVPLASVEAYHQANDSWAPVAPMTVPREGPGIGVLGGLLYAVGGQNDLGPHGLQVLKTVEVYNPATNTWAGNSLIAPMKFPRHDFGVGVLGGVLYAVGGASGDGPYLSSVEAYHAANNSWTLVAPMSVDRVGLGVGVLGGLLYAVGGHDSELNVHSSVEAYNPATNSWTLVANMSVGRQDLGVGVLGGMLYAVGGFNIDSPTPYLASVEAFHPANDSWSELSE